MFLFKFEALVDFEFFPICSNFIQIASHGTDIWLNENVCVILVIDGNRGDMLASGGSLRVVGLARCYQGCNQDFS